ncbi:tRNA (adenosine(37)-N6)-threonylcarbamoyltransferase complex ATPase subunit type 1 TsaE [Mucilaginibacter auburnensis]|uniref:tRNA threonylcarbamoyladenosine biosynthesis protein TsaE n=1 Tax=Mucilaginibacter auburnensis TaxID=1457233 RepID=A0A2H9VS91_9SPHI|nr:tRNA (adenosine(37)-N6)-threonylcarbamoyltransferase complex ATPase subunit type 1 TsaE [Mucilaginibacter auburnensis]PJJ83691.1 tRNA threonylcarbamoyladenosine biosynthesis protein TsaE [Mucilaginibacter auburnensis]
MQLKATSITDLPAIAQQLLSLAGNERIFLFYGDMGAGKTTLIKALCAELGVSGAVSSPTFVIVNEYNANAGRIFHFDFYRLKTQTEALDMGCEEYFYSGDYCFIEWPEKIPDMLPLNYVNVTISVINDTARNISFEKV